MHNIVNLKRSVATLAAAAGLLAAAAGPANAQVLPGTIGLTMPNAGQGREVSSDTLCTDSNQLAIEDLTLTREPARTVTCLDQDLNSLKPPAGSSRWDAGITGTIRGDAQDTQSTRRLNDGSGGDYRAGVPGLKFDANEDAGPYAAYAAPHTSLGRENSIEI